jgi:hypothetical protein
MAVARGPRVITVAVQPETVCHEFDSPPGSIDIAATERWQRAILNFTPGPQG